MTLTAQTAHRKDRTAEPCAMEHRHFATIANIIVDIATIDGMGRVDRERVAKHFAARLVHTNPRFDRRRFLAACGVE